MKILAAATTVGAAEALIPVIKKLSALGHMVTLIGVGNDTPETRRHGGSASVFSRQSIPFVGIFDLGYQGSVMNVPGAFIRSVVAVERPDRILVGCVRDPSGSVCSIEEGLIEISLQMGLEVVQIIDGWDVWYPRRNGHCATAFAVQDRLAKKVLVKRGGIDESRIFVTGQPAFDALVLDGLLSLRETKRHELGLNGERVLLYCSQVSSRNPQTLKWLVRTMRPSDRLIFQIHPRDQRDYSETLSSIGNRLIASELSTRIALAVADVCITHFSTVGLHAVALGIPTINILLDKELKDVRDICGGYPLGRMGLSREVHSEAGLAVALGDQLNPHDPQTVLALLNVDGTSADRVVEVIEGKARLACWGVMA